VIIKRRRRFKQTVPLKDRLMTFADDLRKEASILPPGQGRNDILKRARLADTALGGWLHSPGL
jgi:hypothetical protein